MSNRVIARSPAQVFSKEVTKDTKFGQTLSETFVIFVSFVVSNSPHLTVPSYLFRSRLVKLIRRAILAIAMRHAMVNGVDAPSFLYRLIRHHRSVR